MHSDRAVDLLFSIGWDGVSELADIGFGAGVKDDIFSSSGGVGCCAAKC